MWMSHLWSISDANYNCDVILIAPLIAGIQSYVHIIFTVSMSHNKNSKITPNTHKDKTAIVLYGLLSIFTVKCQC